MNQLDNSSVSPVYMSQVEANQVMELWATRQREEAERHGMVTVHDVAEATQLTPQEVQHLLQTVRVSRQRSEPTNRSAFTRPEDIPLLPAIIRVLPYTGIVTLIWALFLENRGHNGDRGFASGLIIWSIVMALFSASKVIHRLATDAMLGRTVRKKVHYGSER